MEIPVSKEAYKHVVIIGVDGAGAFFKDADIPEVMTNVSFDALDMNIGQDGTGVYKYNLSAQLDEFIITADVLDEETIAALKSHYHVK